MKLQIKVDENLHEDFENFLSENSFSPETIVESEGLDGVAIWHYILEYGPDTLKLLTAIVAFWNEVKKARKPGEKHKIEIVLEAGDDKKDE